MIRNLQFEHRGEPYRLEIEDYGDDESSDTVEVFGPDDAPMASYDTCLSNDSAVIAEAKLEIELDTPLERTEHHEQPTNGFRGRTERAGETLQQ